MEKTSLSEGGDDDREAGSVEADIANSCLRKVVACQLTDRVYQDRTSDTKSVMPIDRQVEKGSSVFTMSRVGRNEAATSLRAVHESGRYVALSKYWNT